MNRYHDDDDGQIDGDFGGAVQFRPNASGVPWARSGTPPWHLWGNTQTLALDLAAGANFGTDARGQMLKIGYARPDTWHWLFTCRVVSFDPAEVGQQLQIQVIWELTTGVGRSMQQNLAFDVYNLIWTNPGPPTRPITLIWTTETVQVNPNRDPTNPTPPANFIHEIVGQDIQLNVRAVLETPVATLVAKRAVIELGAQMAPKTHVRADWYQNDIAEVKFAGSETGGK